MPRRYRINTELYRSDSVADTIRTSQLLQGMGMLTDHRLSELESCLVLMALELVRNTCVFWRRISCFDISQLVVGQGTDGQLQPTDFTLTFTDVDVKTLVVIVSLAQRMIDIDEDVKIAMRTLDLRYLSKSLHNAKV
jgi:hypothetical protein